MPVSFPEILNHFEHIGPESGGVHTPPEARLFLCALVLLSQSKSVLETGYDAGDTTEALCLTGANITAVDDSSEYPWTKEDAGKRLERYSNCTLRSQEAERFFRDTPDNTYDFIFLDDGHGPEHIRLECLEIRRTLKPGGLVAFHDTVWCKLWPIIDEVFSDWQRINLPCFSPVIGRDFGLGLARKPVNEPGYSPLDHQR